MVNVPTFQAHALTRPTGWELGLHDGTLGEDGFRLFRDGIEVLHLTVGSVEARAMGPMLVVVVDGGELVLELRPPYPADPVGTALGFAAYLAGTKAEPRLIEPPAEQRKVVPPWWLQAVAFLPITVDILTYFSVSRPRWLTAVAGGAFVVNFYTLRRSSWSLSRRSITIAAVSVWVCAFMVFCVVVYRK